MGFPESLNLIHMGSGNKQPVLNACRQELVQPIGFFDQRTEFRAASIKCERITDY
jgi:hypothetical protein